MAFKRIHPKPAEREPVLQELLDDNFEFMHPSTKQQEWSNQRRQEFFDAPISQKLKRRHHYHQALCNAIYGEVDAKLIPYEDLKIMASLSSDDPLDGKYAERIKSPVTGIRAFCINCMGGNASYVRNCTMPSCVLFPFRMGSNPFYGRIENPDADAVEDIVEEADANQA